MTYFFSSIGDFFAVMVTPSTRVINVVINVQVLVQSLENPQKMSASSFSWPILFLRAANTMKDTWESKDEMGCVAELIKHNGGRNSTHWENGIIGAFLLIQGGSMQKKIIWAMNQRLKLYTVLQNPLSRRHLDLISLSWPCPAGLAKKLAFSCHCFFLYWPHMHVLATD